MASIRKNKKALKKSLEKMTTALVVFSKPHSHFPLEVLFESKIPVPDGKYTWIPDKSRYIAGIDPYKPIDEITECEITISKIDENGKIVKILK